jgi:peptidoglycan/LPS O-acetylase OafA/YrhL
MLVGQAVRLAVVGVVAGIAMSVAVMPLLGHSSGVRPAIRPRWPSMLALVIVAVVAALVPARDARDPRRRHYE